ncbi:MAG: ATP-binding protein [Candidatus Heimdallarchaeota archaeon]
MLPLFEKLSRVTNYLSQYPKIGKTIGSVLGLLEVPILDLIYFIDKRIRPGSHFQLMKYFSLFYGSRIIPLQTKIESIPIVAPTEEIMRIIDRVPAVSIGYCYCRDKYKNCDNPVWTCIHIGTAKHLEELGKKIPLTSTSKEEVKKLLHKADELGLVHQLLTSPSPDYVYVICNCCPCCCVMLKNAIQYNLNRVAIPSHFIVQHDRKLCVNCGTCVQRCNFKALTQTKQGIEVDHTKCVGCGLCVSTCPENALTLKRREEMN